MSGRRWLHAISSTQWSLATTDQTTAVAAIPTVYFTAVAAGSSVRVDTTGSFSTNGPLTGYSIDWGDGSTPATTASASHAYARPTSYVIVVSITDSIGRANSSQRTVEITGTADTSTARASLTSTVDGLTVSLDASGSSTPAGSFASYRFSFGDSAAAQTSSAPTVSHTYGTAGSYTATVTATDVAGSIATASTSFKVAAPVVAPPPPTPSSTGNGDSGVNQTGVAGKQQTGTGIVLYDSLAKSGDLTTTIKPAANSQLSFATGTFSFSDFTHGLDGAASASGQNASGLQLPANLVGLLGAGSQNTTLQMISNTSSKAGGVPAQSTGSTNQLYLIDAGSLRSGFVWDGINMAGTPQGHLYNGVRMKNPSNLTVSNSTFSGVPGNSGSPPGETFTINIYAQSASSTVNFTRDTFESKQLAATSVAAAMLGTNSTQGTINITDCLFVNAAYSAGIAIWELSAGGTINIVRPVMKGCHRNLGNEAQAGTINITDPLFGDPSNGEDDIRVTWTSNYNGGIINVYFTTAANWTAFQAGRTNKKILTQCTVKQSYGGSAGGAYTGSKSILSNLHVFVAGVEQNRADYWTVSGSPSN